MTRIDLGYSHGDSEIKWLLLDRNFAKMSKIYPKTSKMVIFGQNRGTSVSEMCDFG